MTANVIVAIENIWKNTVERVHPYAVLMSIVTDARSGTALHRTLCSCILSVTLPSLF